MSQLNIFDFTHELPEKGEVLQFKQGKMYIAGIYPVWPKGHHIIWTEGDYRKRPHQAKGMQTEEFKQKLEEGEFWRV